MFLKLNSKRKIRLVEIADILINNMKLTRSDIVIVYSSLTSIYPADFQPEDLIYLFKMIVGNEGAVLMPVKKDITNYISNYELTQDAQNPYAKLDLVKKKGIGQIAGNILDGKNPKLFYAWGKIPIIAQESNIVDNSKLGQNYYLPASIQKAKIIGIGFPEANITFIGTVDNSIIKFQGSDNLKLYEDELGLSGNERIHFYLADSDIVFNKWYLLSALRSQ